MLNKPRAAGRADSQASLRLNRYVGDKIRRARIRQGISPTDLARTLGIEEDSLAEYELGLVKVAAPMLHRVAETLDVSLSSLFGFG